MNIMELGAIGELVGGVAVIASLLFVGLQIRANTRTVRADAGTRAQMEWADLNRVLSQHPDRETIVRFLDPGESYSDFTPNERNAIVFFMRSIAMQFEAQFVQYRANLLDPEVWATHAKGFASLLRPSAARQWWESEKAVPIYTPSFLEAIDAAESVLIPSDNLTGGTPPKSQINGGT